MKFRYLPFPEGCYQDGGECYNLQTAEYHTEAEEEFADIRYTGEVLQGADFSQSGSDIGQTGNNGREGCRQIKPQCRHKHRTESEYYNEQDKETGYRFGRIIGNRIIADLYGDHRVRVDCLE